MFPEKWLPVVGWEGRYEVSNLGQVRSLDMTYPNPLTGGTSRRSGKVLSPRLVDYYRVTLYPGRRTQSVHRLVCEAFHGPAPDGLPEARHLNDVKTDNRAINLAWGSRADNSQDAVRNGRNANARKTHCPRGHEYTPENTRVQVRGRVQSRLCRECMRLHEASRSPRKRADPSQYQS